MESLQELLASLEDAKTLGRTVLKEVLVKVGTKLVLRRLTWPQVSSEETPKGLEVEDQFTQEQPISSDPKPAWWVTLMQEQASEKAVDPYDQLDEVDIVGVVAKKSPTFWNIQDLIDFDYSDKFESGLLEVSFKDIPTDADFDGYIIEAKPVNSIDEGVTDYKSPSLIARPRIVGDIVTEVLNLVPDTKYYVTVYAVIDNAVRISPKQHCSDYNTATTLLSAPLLDPNKANLVDPDYVGLRASTDNSTGIRSHKHVNNLRWTSFQFTVHDDHGNTVARKVIDIKDGYLDVTRDFFQSIFTTQRGDLTLSVSQGYMVGHKYLAVSDTVSVQVELPMYSLNQWYKQFW